MFRFSFLLLLTASCLIGCRPAGKIVSVQTEILEVDSTCDGIRDTAYEQQLVPIVKSMKEQLGVVIGVATGSLYTKRPESPMSNWASDALLEIAQNLYSDHVDAAIVNMGGLRCEWQAGEITKQHVYELMPFDNQLVVITLSGKEMRELCQVIVRVQGEGIAGMRIQAHNGTLRQALINGKPIDDEAEYHIATSDYLSAGMDQLIPLSHYTERWDSGQNIRDLYMKYIEDKKEVKGVMDGRMVLEVD